MNGLVKLLAASYDAQQIVWFRIFSHLALVAAVFMPRMGLGLLRTRRVGTQIVSSLMMLLSTLFFFSAVKYVPVAEAISVTFVAPLAVVLLAWPLLGERITLFRLFAVIVGFSGVLIVIRPGSGLFGWAVLLPLAGSVAYASFQVLTRKLASLESPFTTHFYTGLTGSLIVALALLASDVELLPALQAAPPSAWAMLLAIGTLGTAGHLMLVLAFGLAPTSTLMPFMYVQIAFAAAVGWLVFRHAPDGWGWLGMAVVSVCGAASAWLNVREAAAARAPVTALGADTIVD